ncbi:MAG: DUF1573 domain-containing protein [Williamsia sp.]|nr:DUF1573 domain-containing protein [Williamsia sp.]
MKKGFLLFCAFALTTAVATAQKADAVSDKAAATSQKKADAVVQFKEVKYDFGKIKQGVPVTHDFVFANIGNQPVVIESANASCGCTTPTWPKTPVMKSKTDKVSAGFNAASVQPFEKSIFVKVAGYDLPIELKITGEVLSSEDYAKYEATKGKKNS